MHWILQSNLYYESGWEDIRNTLINFDIPFSEHKVIPFIGELEPTPILETNNVICFGSYAMRHIAKKNNWNPGVIDLFEQNFIIQRDNWGDWMLNYDSDVLPFKDVVLTDARFMRPIDDSKYFAGKVFEPEEFHDWQHKVCDLKEDFGDSLTGDTIVQVCSYKEIYSEYRFWIVGGEIVTYSLYKRGDKVIYENRADLNIIHFVNQAIRIWSPADAYVLDVCDTPDGIKIVEINTINAAGLYSADVQKLVMSLEEEYDGY